MKVNFLLIFVVSVFVSASTSCMGIRSAGSKHVDTFYKGKGNILFFVNSFVLRGKQRNPDISWDFTYNFQSDSIRPVHVNFSVFGERFLSGPYTASMNGLPLDSVSLMFADLKGGKHVTRLTGSLSYADFCKVAQNNTMDFRVQYGKDSLQIRSGRVWAKKAQHIRNELLDVVKLTEFQK